MAVEPMHLEVKGTTAGEAATLIPVLRPYVSLEIERAGSREAFLFVQGVFTGTCASLERLRALLADPKPADVTLVSADKLAGLYGKQVTVMALVLDPSGALGT